MTRREIENAIRECEAASSSYQNCEKLATLYTIYDHLYAEQGKVSEDEVIIGDYGVSDFMTKIRGKKADSVWEVMDELMATLSVTNPRLYDGVMRKIAE